MERILKYIIWAGLASIFFIPLLVKANYFFPFIVPKSLAFRIIAEIIFLAYLGLAVIRKEYRPKLNLVIILFFLYILSVFISSAIGGNFYFSFWSNNERSEGIILLLHLFVFLITSSGFLRKTEDWLVIFEVSFFGSLLASLVALGQFFELSWVLPSSGGARLTSTIGNAGYLAGYLIFNIFFGLILLLFKRGKQKIGKFNINLYWYYVLGIILQLFIILNTQTRGGIIAIIFSSFIFVIYLTFFYSKNNKLFRNTGIAVLLSAVIIGGFVFSNREDSWVKDNPLLSRMTTELSLESITVQNRLMTWQSSYEGFKEKPILGYGYENFYQVFDKYFNPQIYRDAGSVVWFDRAHNIFFDRLITGGIVGLVLYLGLLLAPVYYTWRNFKKEKMSAQYLIPIIFTLLMVAYFIQNLFIFEALVTYIPLFMSLAFLSRFSPSWSSKIFSSNKPYVVLLTLGLILFLPILFIVNVKPASANKMLIEAMVRKNVKEHRESQKYFTEAIEKETFGNQEYRQHFGEFVAGAVNNPELDSNWQMQTAIKMEQEFDKQIQEKPNNTRNYLMFMRFLNRTYKFNVERLNKSLELFEKAVALSPTRPHLYYESGYSQFYLGKYYKSQGEMEKAEQIYEESLANFQKAIDLNDQVVESYVNMIMVLLAIGQDEKVESYLSQMDEMNLVYRRESILTRMASSAVNSESYQWTLLFYNDLTEIEPGKPEYWVNLALSYAHLGQEDEAVAIAEKVKEFGGDYVGQAETFIKDVLDGKFEAEE